MSAVVSLMRECRYKARGRGLREEWSDERRRESRRKCLCVEMGSVSGGLRRSEEERGELGEWWSRGRRL